MPEEGSAQHPQALLRESVSLSTIDTTVRESTGRRPTSPSSARRLSCSAKDQIGGENRGFSTAKGMIGGIKLSIFFQPSVTKSSFNRK